MNTAYEVVVREADEGELDHFGNLRTPYSLGEERTSALPVVSPTLLCRIQSSSTSVIESSLSACPKSGKHLDMAFTQNPWSSCKL